MVPDDAPDLVPSVFDRLTDKDPTGASWQHGYALDDLAAAVQRDLENLLNTGTSSRRVPEAFVHTRGSIAAYGLPEVITRRLSDPKEQDEIARVIEDTIRRFEPRLTDVAAEPAMEGQASVAKLRFRVRARLAVAGTDESFETVLELATGRCRVKRSSEVA